MDSLERVWLTSVRLPGEPDPKSLLVDQGVIKEITSLPSPPGAAENARIFDLDFDWLSLGGVDLQINGALGLPFPDFTEQAQEHLVKISQFLWQQGVDGFLPTLVTSPVSQLQTSLSAFAKFAGTSFAGNMNIGTYAAGADAGSDSPTATLLGLHLEGPFLNPAKKGAHPEAHLLPLEISQVQRVLGEYGSLVKVITLAPELDPKGETISYLCDRGIIVSLGHSLATAAEAQQAFQRGATMVTHAFNAMPSLHHREPGLLGAALVDSRVWCGFIADGQHVCPTMLKLLIRSQQPEVAGLFLVSDALAPLGMPDGLYPWDQRQIEIRAGTARLEDGTLAGTTLPLLAGVEFLVNWGICTPETAIWLATEAPRQAINLPGLGPGQPARNLLRWQQHPETGTLTWGRLWDQLFPSP